MSLVRTSLAMLYIVVAQAPGALSVGCFSKVFKSQGNQVCWGKTRVVISSWGDLCFLLATSRSFFLGSCYKKRSTVRRMCSLRLQKLARTGRGFYEREHNKPESWTIDLKSRGFSKRSEELPRGVWSNWSAAPAAARKTRQKKTTWSPYYPRTKKTSLLLNLSKSPNSITSKRSDLSCFFFLQHSSHHLCRFFEKKNQRRKPNRTLRFFAASRRPSRRRPVFVASLRATRVQSEARLSKKPGKTGDGGGWWIFCETFFFFCEVTMFFFVLFCEDCLFSSFLLWCLLKIWLYLCFLKVLAPL